MTAEHAMNPKDWTLDAAPRLDGRRAVVTGASGGLGFETALGLARRGAGVVLAARNPAKAQAALARIAAAVPGADVRFVPLDLADLASVERWRGRGRGRTAPHPRQQRRRDGLRNPAGDAGRLRGAVRHQLSRPFRADSPAAAGAARGRGPGAGRLAREPSAPERPDRPRRSAGRAALRSLDRLSAEQARHADLRPRTPAPGGRGGFVLA